MAAVKTQAIDNYVAKRRLERGRKKGDLVSPSTVNKELRHLRAILRVAHEWGHLPAMPKFRMVREPGKLPTYVPPDHFADMYAACDVATMPRGLPFDPADWWRALLTFTYMTGWRVGEPLAIPREDVDLDSGTAIMRHNDNKGKRDELVPLHPVVVEHLQRIVTFGPLVFPWPHHRRTLWVEFRANPRGRRHSPALPREARAHARMPRLRLPRLAAGIRHPERRAAVSGRPAGSHAAQELHHNAEVHQHGQPVEPVGRGPARAGRVEGDCGVEAVQNELEGSPPPIRAR